MSDVGSHADGENRAAAGGVAGDVVTPADLASQFIVYVREVLGMPSAALTDNFLELGGDSIRAIRLSGACHRIGLTLRATRILASPTLGDALATAEQTHRDTTR
jgi:aryl carrier-like protein